MSTVTASKYSVGGLSREIEIGSDPENKVVEISIFNMNNKKITQGMMTSFTQKEAYELAVNIIQSANACNQED